MFSQDLFISIPTIL